MAFPNIDINNPKGSDRVSIIDDAERKTREWLAQCMSEISGYEDGVATVSVLGWTNSTRPNANHTGKYLLGYNTQTDTLEVIGANGQVKQSLSGKSIALLAHPVGSYYWTSNTSFNPNTAWGGTWVRLQDGRCLISDCSTKSYISEKTVGSTGGNEKVELQERNLPPLSLQHTHGVGTYSIYGVIKAKDIDGSTSGMKENLTFADMIEYGGALSVKDRRVVKGYKDTGVEDNAGYQTIQFLADSSHGFTGLSARALRDVGGGIGHENMPPYRTAVCWHRTA